MTATSPPTSSSPPVSSLRISLNQISGVKETSGVEETHDDRLRRRTLTPLVWYFITANAAVDIAIFIFAILERKHPSFGEHIVTDKVLMTMIGGNTVQVAAMIVAAFRGLFDSKPAKKKTDRKAAQKDHP